MITPTVYWASDLPAIPGFREALCDWLREHDVDPDRVIRFEVGGGQLVALLVALKDGTPYADEDGLLATEVDAAQVKRELPKPEDFLGAEATR